MVAMHHAKVNVSIAIHDTCAPTVLKLRYTPIYNLRVLSRVLGLGGWVGGGPQ